MIQAEFNEIVKREQDVLRQTRHFGSDQTISISRTAHQIRDLVEPRLVEGRSMYEQLGLALGLPITTPDIADSVGQVYPRIHVDDEHRKKYGYGTLPDGLIMKVERELSFMLPEHMPGDNVRIIAGHVMTIVSDRPYIYPSQVLAELQTLVEAGELVKPMARSVGETAIYGAIIDVTHEITTAWFESSNANEIPIEDVINVQAIANNEEQ